MLRPKLMPFWATLAIPLISLPPAMTPAAAMRPLWSLAHSVNAALTCSVSKPCLKPSMKLLPMVLPSSTAPDASKPRIARRPWLMPLPSVSPNPPTFSTSQGLPVLSHHALKGSATILFQAMPILPQMPALAHSSELVNSEMVALRPAILLSMVSMTRPMTASTAGILVVSQSANWRTYGDNLDPRDSFTPSTADCKRVMLPCMLSSMVSLICWAAPSAL